MAPPCLSNVKPKPGPMKPSFGVLPVILNDKVYILAMCMWASLVPRLDNLFSVHENKQEPGIQSYMTNVTPHIIYTKLGRVAGHD